MFLALVRIPPPAQKSLGNNYVTFVLVLLLVLMDYYNRKLQYQVQHMYILDNQKFGNNHSMLLIQKMQNQARYKVCIYHNH